MLLQRALGAAAPGACVVKSLCNLSAEALLRGDPLVDPLKSVAASDSRQASGFIGPTERAGAAGRSLWLATHKA